MQKRNIFQTPEQRRRFPVLSLRFRLFTWGLQTSRRASETKTASPDCGSAVGGWRGNFLSCSGARQQFQLRCSSPTASASAPSWLYGPYRSTPSSPTGHDCFSGAGRCFGSWEDGGNEGHLLSTRHSHHRFTMHTVSKDFSFEAAHQLNPELLGHSHKCCRVHGHSYRIRIYCSAETLDARGFVVDYAEISAAVEPVIDSLDHRFLNDILPFHTTAENIAAWLFDTLRPSLLSLSRVDVFETSKTCCTYTR